MNALHSPALPPVMAGLVPATHCPASNASLYLAKRRSRAMDRRDMPADDGGVGGLGVSNHDLELSNSSEKDR